MKKSCPGPSMGIVDPRTDAAQPSPRGNFRESTRSSASAQRAYYQSRPYRDALRRAGVPLQAEALFQELVRSCGARRCYTWKRQDDLARELRCSTRTIQRWERALVEAGVVTVARFSHWARWRRGGKRRVVIIHVAVGGDLILPPGILRPGSRLEVDGEKIRTEVLHAIETKLTRVSHEARVASSMGEKKSKPRRPPAGSSQWAWIRRALGDPTEWLREMARGRLRSWGIDPATWSPETTT